MKSITKIEYAGFEKAFNVFNEQLFNSALPPCLITLQKKGQCYGYFSPNRFSNRLDTNAKVDEIALNPNHFKGRSDLKILSTLVHEMTHHYQSHFGKPSRSGYHNKEWAELIESVGLMPSDTGKPGGKRTGQRMSHYIIRGGRFEQFAKDLLNKGFRLNWEGIGVGAKSKNRSKNKVKFSCSNCMQNAWAKPSAKLNCGICTKKMDPET